jgi:hypothetical protein
VAISSRRRASGSTVDTAVIIKLYQRRRRCSHRAGNTRPLHRRR